MAQEEKTEITEEASSSAFLGALYGDPLRAETMRTARHLIIASAISIAVVLFKVRLQSTSLIPIDFGDRVDVLPMLLALTVLMLLLSFLVRAATDLLQDREAAILVTRYIERERTSAAEAASRQTDREIARAQEEDRDGPFEPDPWWEPYYEIREASDKAVSKAEERVGVRRLPRSFRQVRKWTEVGVPIVVGAVSLFLSKSSLLAFAIALVSALNPF
jgi:hypothetical protein